MESELAERWWRASETFRSQPDWVKVAGQLGSCDPRVLVLGPGERDPAHPLTKALTLFLQRIGLSPRALTTDSDPAAHREFAADFPWIIALPISVGSCAEVLDFAHRDALRERLSVILPEEYNGGYFARIIGYDHSFPTRYCGTVSGFQSGLIDEKIGIKVLLEVTKYVRVTISRSQAREKTDEAPVPSSIQARDAGVMPPDEDYSLLLGSSKPEEKPVPSGDEQRQRRIGVYIFAMFLLTLLAAGIAYRLFDPGTTLLVTRAAACFGLSLLTLFFVGEIKVGGKLGTFEVRAVAGFAVLVLLLYIFFFSPSAELGKPNP